MLHNRSAAYSLSLFKRLSAYKVNQPYVALAGRLTRESGVDIKDTAWQQQLDSLWGTSLLSLKKRGLCTMGNCRTSSPLQSTALEAISGSSAHICLLERAASQPCPCQHMCCHKTQRDCWLSATFAYTASALRRWAWNAGRARQERKGLGPPTWQLSAASAPSQYRRPAQRCATSLHHRQQAALQYPSCTRFSRLSKGACVGIGVTGRPGRLSICRK